MLAMHPRQIQQFRDVARREFQFLSWTFGFREMQLSDEDRFAVQFISQTTQVLVEGIEWGLRARVAIGRAGEHFENYDVGDLVTVRCPSLRSECPDGQLQQIAYWASALQKCAPDVLSGNFSVFPELQALVEARRPSPEHCDFCGRGESEVQWFYEARDARICDVCVRAANRFPA